MLTPTCSYYRQGVTAGLPATDLEFLKNVDNTIAFKNLGKFACIAGVISLIFFRVVGSNSTLSIFFIGWGAFIWKKYDNKAAYLTLLAESVLLKAAFH